MQTNEDTMDYTEAFGCNPIGGIMFAEYVTERSLNAIKNYEIRHDDMWICAYPKAGTCAHKVLASNASERLLDAW